MLQRGISEKDVKKTCYENALEVFGKSGKMKEEHWKNIGIRIEDDVLVTKDEPEILTVSALKSVDEMER